MSDEQLGIGSVIDGDAIREKANRYASMLALAALAYACLRAGVAIAKNNWKTAIVCLVVIVAAGVYLVLRTTS